MKKNNDGFTLAEAIVIIAFLGVLVVGLFSLFGGASAEPNAAVMRAAKTITPVPIVADRRFAWSGCSSGDTFRFDVKDASSGARVGYVCQGWSLIPGLERGATPRFD